MTLPELCIRRPVMTTLLMATFVVIGLFAYRLLPVAALPRVDFPTIQVSASLPGANPETMAASVATPLERQFSTIAGISSMTSSSSQGQTQISLQFNLDRDIDGAALDVQAALTAAARRLPEEMTTPPSFRKVNPADQPILFLALTGNTLPLSAIDEYGETMIAQRISTLPGVAQVLVFGAQKHAVRVQVDPNSLAAMGVGFDEVRDAIAGANSNKPVGTLSGADRSVVLQATDQMNNAAQYQPLIIAYRNGMPVRLGEVAQIIDSVENDKTASWLNGERSILLALQRQPDANTVQVVDAVKALIPDLQAQLPASVKLSVMFDRSESIRASVHDVQFTLGLTICLVILVIFVFLRSVTATIIPALVLPVSIIGTFAGMQLLGYSIDNLSLLALTLSVGFVVDDAIVMLENIARHVENGERPWDAALKASREIAFTIISITLSLVAVFIPVIFMGGVVGRLFREFAITISMTILISGFVSLTLTPMMCSRLLRPHVAPERHNMAYRWSEAAYNAVFNLYRASLGQALRFRPLVLALTIASLGATAYLAMVIPKGFFPTEDTGLISASTEGSEDISFVAMAAAQQQAAAIVAADPAVATVNSSVGSGSAGGAENSGRMFIGLKPFKERKLSSADVIQRLRPKLAQIPGLNVFLQPIQNLQIGGRSSRSQYQVTMQGTDLSELQRLAPQFETALQALPILQDVTSDLEISSPQILVDIDRDRAAVLDIDADQIRDTLYAAYGSRQVATIYEPTNDYEVILEIDPRYRQDAEALRRLYVRAGNGTLVPLESVARFRHQAGPLSVNHQAQLPAVTFAFNLTPGVSLGQAVTAIEGVKSQMSLPAGVSTTFQGTAQVFQDALGGQGLLLLAAVFVIYVVLGILYESFIHPITILSGLPAAGLGALITLILFKMDLNVIAIIGIVMLIGIVKKNAIMMVDVAIERRQSGASAEAAIYEACLLRFRPIMMTTMAAIMGTLPIALGHGAGAELRQPLGLAVGGGLVVSQALTLYITPVVYLYFEKLSSRFRRDKESRAYSG